ncbi:MAG TPA: hypothetical protein VKD91_23330 [Pyrinomonadaceae bacterium]|nr:hypothetical protein [Pyrinomonadaceae bacterium]
MSPLSFIAVVLTFLSFAVCDPKRRQVTALQSSFFGNLLDIDDFRIADFRLGCILPYAVTLIAAIPEMCQLIFATIGNQRLQAILELFQSISTKREQDAKDNFPFGNRGGDCRDRL